MIKTEFLKISRKKEKNVTLILFFYWAVLVFWQNINESVIAGTTADTIIKLGLLGSLSVYFLLNPKSNYRFFLLFGLFVAGMIMSFSMESPISLRSFVNYLYPIIFVFLTLLVGDKNEINKKQLLTFLKLVIVLVLYAACYAIVMMPEKFLNAMNISGAYGNELSSFFVSNHEYALYLSGGIISCIMCLELDKKKAFTKVLVYLVIILFLGINLILTFSRTFMLGMLCFFIMYCLLNIKSSFSKLALLTAGVVAIAIFAIPEYRDFVFEILMKENNLAGRDELSEYAIQLFRKAEPFEKLFGQGVTRMQYLFATELGHASVHNGYLQIMLYFGVVGLAFMICFLLTRLIASIKAIKKHKFIGIISVAFVLMCVVIMPFNTTIIFTSQIDSYFLTMFMLTIPKYVINSISAGTFE